ncbi:hypothetical protein O181_047053 [Austropuccinia psidii MF-1]|uniref:Uncharacterized protein n=1 Tax=Austropuccinia psidii MF-1 TaxID=1389203 RepID=A0A9Q3HJ50_9BASI|nr:hypothetical protein [Austropuccinia psidii MF-1]
MNPSPIPQPRTSPVLTSHQFTPCGQNQKKRKRSATKFFQRRECLPIRASREDPNVGKEVQDAISRLFRRVYRNNREVIVYANHRISPGTASEEMAAKLSWNED